MSWEISSPRHVLFPDAVLSREPCTRARAQITHQRASWKPTSRHVLLDQHRAGSEARRPSTLHCHQDWRSPGNRRPGTLLQSVPEARRPGTSLSVSTRCPGSSASGHALYRVPVVPKAQRSGTCRSRRGVSRSRKLSARARFAAKLTSSPKARRSGHASYYRFWAWVPKAQRSGTHHCSHTSRSPESSAFGQAINTNMSGCPESSAFGRASTYFSCWRTRLIAIPKAQRSGTHLTAVPERVPKALRSGTHRIDRRTPVPKAQRSGTRRPSQVEAVPKGSALGHALSHRPARTSAVSFSPGSSASGHASSRFAEPW